MFNNLSQRLSAILQNINNFGCLTENDIKKTLQEIRDTLLESDVSLPIVKNFINHVKEKAVDSKISKILNPRQELIKIVYNELILAMGKENQTLNLSVQPPAVIMMVGLQGVGKTTSVAKLGNFIFKKYKKKTLVVSTDVYRPAAIQQLEILSQQAKVDFFPSNINQNPIDIVDSALEKAKLKFYDVLLVDTVGCLHINDKIMNEIKHINNKINPIETLFVIDAMAGQDSVNVANTFNKLLHLSGIVITKADCDSRGGVALSVCNITKKPIKFLCFGEKIETLEPFYPERIASRILGMGDILSLIENINDKANYKQSKKFETKLKKGNNLDLSDFLEQLYQIKNMGGIVNILEKFPKIGRISDTIKTQIDDKILLKMEAIINSMTLKERSNPDIIKGSRKRRIALGCGMKIQDVNRLLKQFHNMKHMTKKTKIGTKLESILQKLRFKF